LKVFIFYFFSTKKVEKGSQNVVKIWKILGFFLDKKKPKKKNGVKKITFFEGKKMIFMAIFFPV
jgi:hypothetical protein